MNAQKIIDTITDHGGELRVIDGGLRGKGLTEETRSLVKKHRAEIIHILLHQIPTELLLKPCPFCGGRDFIHGDKGGYFCVTCQPNVRPGKPILAEGTWK